MKTCLRYLFILLFCAISLVAVSQNRYVISGVMTDNVKNEKIFYATVVLMTADSSSTVVTGAFTDAAGKFQLEDVTAGEYVLRATLVGYETFLMPLTVEGDQRRIDLGELPMQHGFMMLNGVVVTEQAPVYMMDGEKTLYNVSEDPTIQSGTASDALQNAPGVEVDVEGNVTLRGVSSVEIWINNKPSNMQADALKDFIQQLPANSLERIEVITNPSARYSAKGSGGIINIITSSKIKKNSFVSFGLRGSSQPDISPFLSYVYANDKLSLSFYTHYNYGFSDNESSSQSIYLDEHYDTLSYYSTQSSYLRNNHGTGLFFNGSYQIDSMNMISFWTGCFPNFARSNSSQIVYREEYGANPAIYDYFYENEARDQSGGGYGGIWYEHKFNDLGHRISADIGGHMWGSKDINSTVLDYARQSAMDQKRETPTSYISGSVDGSVDYTIPYHKDGEIEVGVSGTFDYENNQYERDTLVQGTEDFYQRDNDRSAHYLSPSGSFETYVTLQHRFGGFTLKGGLRSENEWYKLHYLDAPEHDLKKGYWGLYPSLHLSYRTKNMHNFKLSYSRRVSNPQAEQLTTFITYSDDSYSTGNADLKQTFTNSLEAGWTKFIRKFGNVGVNAYFRNSKDEISSISDVVYSPFFDRYVSYSRPINAGKSLNTGAELNVNYQLKAFLSLRFYANVYYTNSKFQFREEEDMRKVDYVGYSFRFNLWAKVWKFLEINASAQYRSKSYSLFSETRPRYSIDCGLRANVWKNRITLHLNVNDIFNWNKTTTVNNNPYLISTSTSRNSWNSRTIRAGITFRFGKMELESRANQGQGQEQGQPTQMMQ